MDIYNTFIMFKDHVNDKDVYVSMGDILVVGVPINDFGDDLEVVSNELYQWKDIGRGFQYVAIN